MKKRRFTLRSVQWLLVPLVLTSYLLLGLAPVSEARAAQPAAPAAPLSLRIAVSTSLSAEYLESLAQGAALVGGSLAVRGLPVDEKQLEGPFFGAPEAERSRVRRALRLGLTAVQGVGGGRAPVSIDPELFRAYGIAGVPVFVFSRRQVSCAEESAGETYLVRGAVTLPRALAELLARDDLPEDVRTDLQGKLELLEGAGWFR